MTAASQPESPRPGRLRWVLFDVGETLLHPAPDFPTAFADVCAHAGLPVEPDVVVEAAAATWAHRPGASGNGFSFNREASHAFWTGLYTELLESLGEDPSRIPPLADALYEHFSSASSYELFDDARPSLEAFRGAGLRLGIVSNFEAWLIGCLRDLGVLDLFDVTAVSGIEGVEKPDAEIFRRALSRTGADPSEVGYVGDSPADDIAPATALGMRAVLLDRRDRHRDHPGPRISTLRDLPVRFLS